MAEGKCAMEPGLQEVTWFFQIRVEVIDGKVRRSRDILFLTGSNLV